MVRIGQSGGVDDGDVAVAVAEEVEAVAEDGEGERAVGGVAESDVRGA